jgi:hypothetical protein
VIAWLRLPHLPHAQKRPAKVFCTTDQWSFDPRYTQGRCPICGWAPEGAPTAPDWLALVNRFDWDLLGLFLLADVLVILGLIVANAAGLLPAHPGIGLSHSPAGVASGARTP